MFVIRAYSKNSKTFIIDKVISSIFQIPVLFMYTVLPRIWPWAAVRPTIKKGLSTASPELSWMLLPTFYSNNYQRVHSLPTKALPNDSKGKSGPKMGSNKTKYKHVSANQPQATALFRSYFCLV